MAPVGALAHACAATFELTGSGIDAGGAAASSGCATGMYVHARCISRRRPRRPECLWPGSAAHWRHWPGTNLNQLHPAQSTNLEPGGTWGSYLTPPGHCYTMTGKARPNNLNGTSRRVLPVEGRTLAWFEV
jgi:hypothetical protein